VVIALFIFLVGFWIFGKSQRQEQFNPYIKAHKKKWKMQKRYQEYLKWLDKKGGDVPFDEIKYKPEAEAFKEIEKHLR